MQMRKGAVLAALMAVLCLDKAQAQHVELPKEGDFSLELQFKPFKSDGNVFEMDGLKLRIFTSEKDAFRFNIGFSVNVDRNTEDVQIQPPFSGASSDGVKKTTNKTGSITVGTGYERHYATKGRLDFYSGLGINFVRTFRSAKETTENTYGGIVSENKWENTNQDGDRACWGVEVDAFTGLDFYVYKRLFVGVELGLGVAYAKACDGKFNMEEITNVGDAQSVEAKFYVEPALRLGWTF